MMSLGLQHVHLLQELKLPCKKFCAKIQVIDMEVSMNCSTQELRKRLRYRSKDFCIFYTIGLRSGLA